MWLRTPQAEVEEAGMMRIAVLGVVTAAPGSLPADLPHDHPAMVKVWPHGVTAFGLQVSHWSLVILLQISL